MAIGEYVKKQFKQLIPQFLQNHPTCFFQTFLIFLTGAAEQIWEEVGFKCPDTLRDNSHKHYARMNFLGPFISLWMICLLASNMAKRVCQGQGWQCSDKKWCSSFWTVVFQTLVIPLAWVFVSLMDGDIYACYRHLPNCTMGSNNPIFVDGINCTTNITRWNETNKTESKLYGWYFAALCLFLGFVGVTCGRCYSERPYFPNFYSNVLKKRERVEMEKFLEDGAVVTAADNAGAIAMAVNEVKPDDWEAICRLHQNKADDKDAKHYYSPLSEWVGKKRAENKEETPNPNSATQGPNQQDQKSTSKKTKKPKVDGNQVLTPNTDSAPTTEASPEGSASA